MSKTGVCDPVEIFLKTKEKQNWLPKNFGISMLGMCERSSILKKVHAPKKTMDDKKRRTLQLKFDLADYLENDIIDAWFYKGILVSNQLKVNEGLPKNWAGRLDAWLNRWDTGFEVAEIKASHPNMFTMYPLQKPKSYNKFQCLGYIYAINNWFMGLKPLGDLDVDEFLVNRGRVIYMNRGGETDPIQFGFDFTRDDRLEIIGMMKSLNKHLRRYEKSNGKELPQIREKIVKIKKKKKKVQEENVTVIEAHLEPNWQCSWCDFCGVSCDPDLGKNKCGQWDEEGDYSARKGYEGTVTKAVEARVEWDALQKAKGML